MLIEHKHISFSMFAIYMDTADKLPDRERLMLYDAFFKFAFDEIEPDFSKADEKYRFSMQSTFDQSQASIVASIQRHEHGRAGGRKSDGKKCNQNARKDFNAVKTKQSKVNENVNDNAHLPTVNDSVSDGSPLNAEPPSTQSTGDPFAKSKLRKFLEEKERGAGETDAK